MKKLLFLTSLIALSGCEKVVDVPNMCAEMGQTSVGFSGPSKRMDIMKSYGVEPQQAAAIDSILVQVHEIRGVFLLEEKLRQTLEVPWGEKLDCEYIVNYVLPAED